MIGTSSTLTGTLSLDTVTSPASTTPTFIGAITVTGATGGFPTTGFHVGDMVDTDFIGYKGTVSAGQIVPDPIPEPGTILCWAQGCWEWQEYYGVGSELAPEFNAAFESGLRV